MVVERIPASSGTGVISVETVLSTRRTEPGGRLGGEVRLGGGPAGVEHVALVLAAEVGGGQERFSRTAVSGPRALLPGQVLTIPFEVPVPWETPLSELHGRHLGGMALAVRTETGAAGAGSIPLRVAVRPLPSQARVLQAFMRLGFDLKRTGLQPGRVYGTRQQLPFHQEIEFYPPSQHFGHVHEVELSFLTGPDGLAVTLEADRRTGRFRAGGGAGRFQVGHEEALHMDWASEVDRWLVGLTHHGLAGPYRPQGEPGR